MKIVTYNVNGLRSALSKGLTDWIAAERPDILCLQETKAQPEQIPTLELEALGYRCYFFSAVKKGYSGVAILTRREPDRVAAGMGIEKYDAEGRFLRADYGELSVVSVYHPSGTSGDVQNAVARRFPAIRIGTRKRAAAVDPVRRLQHLPPADRHPRPGAQCLEQRFPARRTRMDEPLPGQRLHRHVPAVQPRTESVHLVEFPRQRAGEQQRLADRLRDGVGGGAPAAEKRLAAARRAPFGPLPGRTGDYDLKIPAPSPKNSYYLHLIIFIITFKNTLCFKP